jgi:hypothetical protein
MTCDKKYLWSSDLVLAFVSVNVWRSFISCQTSRETGSVKRRNKNGRHQYKFQNTLKELGK